jgi:hypothetical protein
MRNPVVSATLFDVARVFGSAAGSLGTAKAEAGRMMDMSGFADLTAGWEMSVTMQLRTPLKWLRRHREFHAGAERPTEILPAEHACWVPVAKTWRELGIDADEISSSTMASQIGQIPVDGGDFVPDRIPDHRGRRGGSTRRPRRAASSIRGIAFRTRAARSQAKGCNESKSDGFRRFLR